MIKRLIIILAIMLLPASLFAAVTYTAGHINATLDSTNNDRYYSSGACNTAGTALTLIYTTPGQRYSFFRFPSVSIPKGATITAAALRVYPASGSGSVNLTSTLIDADNCSVLSCTPDLTATTSVHAITSAWVTARTSNTTYDITGIAALVQAWIDRAGYEYGYGIGLKTHGTGESHTVDDYAVNGAALSIDFTGGEPTLAVHMADPHSRTKQYIKCTVYNAASDDKLVVKIDGSAVYNTAIGGSGEQKFINVLVDYTSLDAGAHTIDVYLTNAAAEEYVNTHFDKDYTTTHSGAPAVGLDENNSLIVGGSALFFPVGDFFVNKSALVAGVGQDEIVPLTNISISMGYVPPTAWDTAAGRSFSIDVASYASELSI